MPRTRFAPLAVALVASSLAALGCATSVGLDETGPLVGDDASVGDEPAVEDAPVADRGAQDGARADASGWPDGASDASRDANEDASRDSGVDAGRDSGVDAGSDAGPTCGSGQKLCSGICVANAPAYGCSGSAGCTPCPTPSMGQATCTAGGQCDFTCPGGYIKQGNDCVYPNPSSCPGSKPSGPCLILLNPDSCTYGNESCDCVLLFWSCG